MATKKTAKDKALEDIAAMDKESPEKKDKASSSKAMDSKPRPKDDARKAAPAEDPKEKEIGWKDAEVVGNKIIMQEKEIQADLDKTINAGFDPDDEDAPEPPETEKMKIITTKNIPPEQRFNKVSPVVLAKKTQMITTKNMKEFLKQ